MSQAMSRQRNVGGLNPPIKGGGKRKNRDRRREERWEEAIARQTIRDARTTAEQLAVLTERGHGHCSEAKRLRAALG